MESVQGKGRDSGFSQDKSLTINDTCLDIVRSTVHVIE